MALFNGHGKKLLTLITAVFVLVGMLFTAAWTIDARMEKKIEDKTETINTNILTIKESFENQMNQFEIQTTGAMRQFQRAQDIRYYQAKIEYYNYLLHINNGELSRCGNCPSRQELLNEHNYLVGKINYYQSLLEEVMRDGR